MQIIKTCTNYPALILRRITIGLTTGITMLLLLGCSDSKQLSPEDAVKATLSQIEQAAEERSLSKFMQHISDNYSDHQGYRKDDLRKVVQLQYLRNQNIHIFSNIKSLNIDADVATIELSAAMAAKASSLENDGYLKADTHSFSIIMHSPDQQQTWLVESVSWDRGWN